jgi:hypothetical protein
VDAAINGRAWRPWLGGGRLALIRAQVAERAEEPSAAADHAHQALHASGEAAEVVKVFAGALSSERPASLLAAEPIREIRARAG